MPQKIGPGEFEGTFAELSNRLRVARGGEIRWNCRVITPETKLYVDQKGTVYAPAESGRLTIVVGYCTEDKR